MTPGTELQIRSESGTPADLPASPKIERPNPASEVIIDSKPFLLGQFMHTLPREGVKIWDLVVVNF